VGKKAINKRKKKEYKIIIVNTLFVGIKSTIINGEKQFLLSPNNM